MDPVTVATVGSNLLSGLGSFVGGQSQKRATRRAQQEQINAINRALDLQEKQRAETKEAYKPYTEAGVNGITGFEDRITNFEQPEFGYQQKDFAFDTFSDPGAKYRFDQAQKALEASSAKKGMNLSSGLLKGLQTRGQDMASQEYNNSYDRFLKDSAMRYGQAVGAYDRDYGYKKDDIKNFADLTGIGMGANAQVAGQGSQYADSVSKLLSGLGTANANAELYKGGSDAAMWNNLFGQGGKQLFTDLFSSDWFKGAK